MKQLLFVVLALMSAPVYAQQTPEALAALWINAIQTQSVDALTPLIHPDCPSNSRDPEIIERMIDGALPPAYTIKTHKLRGSKELLSKVYIVIPELQLNIDYHPTNAAEKKQFGLGKGFPISSKNGRWYFAICAQPTAKQPHKNK